MTDDRQPHTVPRPIAGGSTQEAELPSSDVAWRAKAEPSESPFAQGLRRLRRSTTALIGAAIVALLLLASIFADVLAPQSPIASDQTHTFERPSRDYPFGTDQLGRDMLSRLVFSTRVSVVVAATSVGLALAIAVPLGLSAGFLGRWVDLLTMRLTDAFQAIPAIILALAVRAFSRRDL